MPGANQELAAIFQQMADVLTLLDGDSFRVNAFQKVARVLGELDQDVAEIGPDVKKLSELEGIGKGSAARIAEYLTTGEIKEHLDLVAKVPPGLVDLLTIQGLGPKTAALLWKQAGVTSLDDLRKKLTGDELAELPGLGPKKLENLRKALAFAAAGGTRVRIGTALPTAAWLVDKLAALPGAGVKQVAYAGSLRRGKETIGDIDLLVAAEDADADAIMTQFVKLPPVSAVLVRGPTKTSVRVSDGRRGMQVDLRIVPPASYGAALLYFTGSKEHNIELRERAIKRGLKLNEYGLFRVTDGEKMIAGKTEEDVYKALGLDWIPPELREDRGEIRLAEKHELPKLIELGDIMAELHAHTTASDGLWTLRELVEQALARGFHSIAITDHSKSQIIANGLSEDRLEQHIEDVRAVAKEFAERITVYTGTEVDILADGSLDYPNSLLKELDVVVASPHAALSQEPAKATHRLLKAIAHPYVAILGHPTGRLILRREGLSPDMRQLFAAAAERGVAMELNANSYRLDLRDVHCRAAVEAGVKLAINTDAHGPADLDQLAYGVLTARRGGVTKEDVVNCWTREQLAKWVRGRH